MLKKYHQQNLRRLLKTNLNILISCKILYQKLNLIFFSIYDIMKINLLHFDTYTHMHQKLLTKYHVSIKKKNNIKNLQDNMWKTRQRTLYRTLYKKKVNHDYHRHWHETILMWNIAQGNRYQLLQFLLTI